MNVQDAFDIDSPFGGSVGTLTVAGLAEEVIAHANVDSSRETDKADAVVSAVAERHSAEKIEGEYLESLKDIADSDGQRVVRLIS
jgi:hypothetical protein